MEFQWRNYIQNFDYQEDKTVSLYQIGLILPNDPEVVASIGVLDFICAVDVITESDKTVEICLTFETYNVSVAAQHIADVESFLADYSIELDTDIWNF